MTTILSHYSDIIVFSIVLVLLLFNHYFPLLYFFSFANPWNFTCSRTSEVCDIMYIYRLASVAKVCMRWEGRFTGRCTHTGVAEQQVIFSCVNTYI